MKRTGADGEHDPQPIIETTCEGMADIPGPIDDANGDASDQDSGEGAR